MSLGIASVRFQNWLCFGGEHALDLGAKAYAVQARSTHDVDASNGNGKSALLEAIDFAFWGRHRKRTEDEWITEGEAVGSVELALTDGSRVTRRRERGKRTVLRYFGPGVELGAQQDEAQAHVARLLCLDQDDFTATAYFQQRQMARFVLTEPARRMEVVAGWIKLAPVERCEEREQARAASVADEVAALEASIPALSASLAEHPREEVEAALTRATVQVDVRRGAVAALQDRLAANQRLVSAREKVRDFELLVADGRRLRAEVEQGRPVEEARAENDRARASQIEAAQRRKMAAAQLEEKRALSTGTFDGTCPLAGIRCPAKDQINADRDRGRAMFEEARIEALTAARAYDDFCQAEALARAELGELERKADQLHGMRIRVAKLEPEYAAAKAAGEPEEPGAIRARLEAAAAALEQAQGVVAQLGAALGQIDRAKAAREAVEARLAPLRAKLATLREAAAVFGKGGAQRRLAEGALGEIEQGANGFLAEAGVGLTVAVRWSREGGTAAKACEACGSPFPASVKVKVCSRCRAPRGRNVINRLEVELGRDSGAYQDLGGIAIQLAAARWLRWERGSPLALAMLDEPFAQMDRSHRRSMASKLPAILRASGVEQALVISHSPDTAGAMPGRIEVVSDGRRSSIRVV